MANMERIYKDGETVFCDYNYWYIGIVEGFKIDDSEDKLYLIRYPRFKNKREWLSEDLIYAYTPENIKKYAVISARYEEELKKRKPKSKKKKKDSLPSVAVTPTTTTPKKNEQQVKAKQSYSTSSLAPWIEKEFVWVCEEKKRLQLPVSPSVSQFFESFLAERKDKDEAELLNAHKVTTELIMEQFDKYFQHILYESERDFVEDIMLASGDVAASSVMGCHHLIRFFAKVFLDSEMDLSSVTKTCFDNIIEYLKKHFADYVKSEDYV